MNRTLTLLMVAGALVSVGCAKKQSTESSGSLLSGSTAPDDEEKEQDKGIRDDDVTQGGQTGPSSPSDRIPR